MPRVRQPRERKTRRSNAAKVRECLVHLGAQMAVGRDARGTVSQAYFALHETLHQVKKILGKKYFLVLRLPLRHS